MSRLFLLVFLFVSFLAHSQISQVSTIFFTGTSVDFYDVNRGFVCGYSGTSGNTDKLMRTTNGGSSWTNLMVTSQTNIRHNFVKHLTFNKVILIGENTFFNEGTVFLSSNNGTNWTDVSPIFTTDRLKDAFFIDSLSGFAVGNNGTIIKTTDGGQTWTDQSVVPNHNFKTTYFIDHTTGFAGAGPFLYRTTDGGSTWNSDTLNGVDIVDFVFFTQNRGFMLSGNGDVYQTFDGGLTWGIQSNDLYAQNYKMEKSPGGKVLLSSTNNLSFNFSGAQYWEKFPGNAGFSAISLSFANDSTCYALSIGLLKKIVIRNPASYVPVIKFRVADGNVCTGDPEHFINESKPGYIYRWYVDNVLKPSTGNDLYHTFPSTGTYAVRLTAVNPQNTAVKDSLTSSYNIPYPPTINPFTVTALYQPICEGQIPSVRVNNSQTTVFYFVTDSSSGAILTTVQYGNGGNLTFNLGNQYQTRTYAVIGRKVTTCDTVSDVKYVTINVVPLASATSDISPERAYLCFGDTGKINIYNSEPGIMYRLKMNNSFTADSAQGNGGLLQFGRDPIYSSIVYSIVGRNSMNCPRLFANDTIRVSVVNSDYSFLNQDLYPGQNLQINSSSVTGDSLKWSFFPDATPYNDTARTPQLSFTAVGVKSALLHVKTIHGCKDSSLKQVYVYNGSPEGSAGFCEARSLPFRSNPANSKYNRVFDMATDRSNNTFLTGFTATTSTIGSVYSDPRPFIIKCDSLMNLKWEKVLTASVSSCKSFYSNVIATDTLGNFYLGGKFFCDYLTIDTIVITSNDNDGEFFIAKFDPNGIAKWIIRGRSVLPSSLGFGGPTSFTVDDQGFLYCTISKSSSIEITFPDGTSLTPPVDRLLLLKIDPSDGSLVGSQVMTSTGSLSYEYQASASAWYTYHSFPLSPKIKYKNGRLYIVGTTTGTLTAGSHVIPPVLTSAANDVGTYYVAVADTALNWLNAYAMGATRPNWNDTEYKLDFLTVFDVDDAENVYLACRWDRSTNLHDTLPSARFNNVSYFTPGNYIAKFDNTGTMLWGNLNENKTQVVRGISVTGQDSLLLAGSFNRFYGFQGSTGDPYGMYSIGARDMFMSSMDATNGNVIWSRKYGSSAGSEELLLMRTSADGFHRVTGTLWNGSTFSMDGDQIVNTMNNITVGKFDKDSACNSILTRIDLMPGQEDSTSLRAWYHEGRMHLGISLPSDSKISLSLLDIQGRLLDVIRNQADLQKGYSEITFPKSVANGIYLVKMDVAEGRSISAKVIVVQ